MQQGLSRFLFFVLLLIAAASGSDDPAVAEYVAFLDNLWKQAKMAPAGSRERQVLLSQLVRLQPRHLETHLMLGIELLDRGNADEGVRLLAECFNQSIVDRTLPENSLQAFSLANFIGRYHHERSDYTQAKHFFELAMYFSRKIWSPSEGDACTALQLASMLDTFPESETAADESLRSLNEYAALFLERKNQRIDDERLSHMVRGVESDPYAHCMLGLFVLSFYYRADVATVAHNHFRMTVAAWPDTTWTAPHVIAYEIEHKNMQLYEPEGQGVVVYTAQKHCVHRRIKLGVISGVITEGHSVTEDFSGVLQRLDRSKFDVTYILLHEQGVPELASFTAIHPQDNTHVLIKTDKDIRNGAWLRRYGKVIANMELDIILYLDLTMSSHARRLGMQRLAPIQINMHGHPVTSGIDRSIMQYFISWAEAEIPEAADHYTEKLLLIPNGKIHQWYEPRILEHETSRLDGGYFGNLTRKDFQLPENRTLYLCMQKPFKLHPEFDRLVAGILRKDRDGHVVLHRADHEHIHLLFLRRLQAAGCDLNRVHFVPAQPHHRLLALYKHATVILDSYPAGGCTTTREVLELQKPLVTLPARLLGGRWTLGYYKVIDLAKEALNYLVAGSEEEYVALAVGLGTDNARRRRVEELLGEANQRLFHQFEAVEEWQKILLQVSPFNCCREGHVDTDEL